MGSARWGRLTSALEEHFGGRRSNGLFPCHRPPADVAPTEAVRPTDFVDRRVGARLCLADAAPPRAYVEHAPAMGDEASALHPRAGVENLDAVELGRGVEPLD